MSCCGGGGFFGNRQQQYQTPQAPQTPVNNNLSPIDALKIRLAKGEITIDEYQKLLAVLQGQAS